MGPSSLLVRLQGDEPQVGRQAERHLAHRLEPALGDEALLAQHLRVPEEPLEAVALVDGARTRRRVAAPVGLRDRDAVPAGGGGLPGQRVPRLGTGAADRAADGPLGEGSVQLFVPHDPDLHYFALVDDPAWRRDLARMATFDLLVNNADRKASHVLLSTRDRRLYGIDHGVAFHAHAKLRTVIWDLEDAPIDGAWRADLSRLAAALNDPGGALTAELCDLLSAQEVRRLALRAGALERTPTLPTIDEHRRPYPWPPL